MTPKQQRFVDEYLIDLNATQAAIRAGFSVANADKIGSQLLGKTRVAAAIAQAKAERSARTGITADRVLEELARLAFSDMGDFAEWGGADVVLKQSSEVDTRCVLEVKETPMKSGGKALGIKLHDKAAALKLAGQHVGLFTERHEVTGKDGGPIQVEQKNAFDFDAYSATLGQLVGMADHSEALSRTNGAGKPLDSAHSDS